MLRYMVDNCDASHNSYCRFILISYISKNFIMKIKIIAFLFVIGLIGAIAFKTEKPVIDMVGTWQLVSGVTITKGVSTVTDYSKDTRMIKIINASHFAFLKHDLNSPKDSVNHFDAGGGSYTLKGDQYTEHLDYYADKHWENKIFTFTMTIKNDTLIQKGLEKVENENIDRIIIEKYLRVK